ncbi:MAG: D-alanyl-D-alanine carboxypeptidase [Proteobacteria bacterium]|nr:D-alanyl-D-alanine carboxypeptidase [Pseudomonadota bacterium]
MHEPARRIAKILAALAIGASALTLPVLAQAQEDDFAYSPSTPLRVNTGEPKYAAIVVDARTGEVLYAKRADSPRYPASITKIMTMYLAFEQLASGKMKPTDLITVSAHAAAQSPTKLGLRPGDQITVEDALHAIAVKSANDMAVAMAEHIGGSESRFAALMTLRAQELGMTNSHFVNASGLPDSRQISTARDIAILSRSVMRDFPQYYSFFSQERFVYRGTAMNNHNGLLGKMPGVDGLKTGFTNAAGWNLAASAVRNNTRLIAVELGGPSPRTRNETVEGLLLTGFDIMDRRAHGENIQYTQNLFEAPTAPTTMLASARPAPSQARPEVAADPIDVVLTRSTNAPPSLTVSNSMAAATAGRGLSPDYGNRAAPATSVAVAPPPARAQRKREAHNWTVQVGAFRNERDARRQLETVANRFARIFDDAEGSVDGGGRSYRARFTGFTETAARDACDAVQAKNLPCTANGPR